MYVCHIFECLRNGHRSSMIYLYILPLLIDILILDYTVFKITNFIHGGEIKDEGHSHVFNLVTKLYTSDFNPLNLKNHSLKFKDTEAKFDHFEAR